MRLNLFNRFKVPLLLTGLILAIGTAGYHIISGQALIDCLYMTVITITTIGFTEAVYTPAARPFTIFIAFAGVAVATYFLSNLTAVIVESDLQQTFRRRKIKKKINKMENHYILCGAGKVGSHILEELHSTNRAFVVIDNNEDVLKRLSEKYPKLNYIFGDADVESTLTEAGIERAKGLFASTGDDNQNLVISLTAKYINPRVRVIARCLQAENQEKMKRGGADSVISENYIAGMRMASEMIRPTVVSFLDKMLSNKDKNLRVEEVALAQRYKGSKVKDLKLEDYEHTLLMAIASGENWNYNPKAEDIIADKSRIVIITNPEERLMLKKEFGE